MITEFLVYTLYVRLLIFLCVSRYHSDQCMYVKKQRLTDLEINVTKRYY